MCRKVSGGTWIAAIIHKRDECVIHHAFFSKVNVPGEFLTLLLLSAYVKFLKGIVLECRFIVTRRSA